MLVELIGRLRDYGFVVEMDDFESGYSSLNMLKDIKVYKISEKSRNRSNAIGPGTASGPQQGQAGEKIRKLKTLRH